MNEDWLDALLLVLLVLAPIAVFLRFQQRSWLGPGPLLAGFWVLVLLLSLLVRPDYVLRIAGVAWITLSVLIFGLGSAVGFLARARGSTVTAPRSARNNSRFARRLLPLFLVSLALGCATIPIYVWNANFSLFDLTSLRKVVEIGHGYSYSRYNVPDYREPAAAIVLSCFIYVGGLLGGSIAGFALGGRLLLLSGAAFLPALAISLLLTTRASFLFTAILWLSAFAATAEASRSAGLRIMAFKRVIQALTLVVFVLGTYVGLQVIRSQFAATKGGVAATTSSAFLGSPSSFTIWFDSPEGPSEDLGLGQRTFHGPIALVFPSRFPRWAPVLLGRQEVVEDSTTVSTLFRELIYDFSQIGSLLFLVVLGFVGGWAYRSAREGALPAIPILTAVYAICLTSHVGSPFAYTTIVVAWVIYGACILFLRRHSRPFALRPSGADASSMVVKTEPSDAGSAGT